MDDSHNEMPRISRDAAAALRPRIVVQRDGSRVHRNPRVRDLELARTVVDVLGGDGRRLFTSGEEE